MEISELLKRMLINLSDLGDSGKSTSMIAAAGGLTALNKEFSKFDADTDHRTFFNAYAQRNKNGEAKTEQDSENGCVAIDINTNPQNIADACAAPRQIVLVDTPARAITAIFESFGVDGAQLFIDTLAFNDTVPFFFIPWIDAVKSPESVNKVYQKLDIIDFSNYVESFKIHLIIARNIGLMNSTSKLMPQQAQAAYNSNMSIQALKADSRFVVHEIELRTQLNQPAINALSGKSIQTALIEKLEPSTKTMLMTLLNDGKKIANILSQ